MKMAFLSRDLSWLDFNARVLQEATDENVPLIERMRFLGIYSNNMDEFYRVRVASIKRADRVGVKKFDDYSGLPSDLLTDVKYKILQQQVLFEATYLSILSLLEEEKIVQVNEYDISEEHKIVLNNYFHDHLRQNIIPVILRKNGVFPKLKEKGIYLAIEITQIEGSIFALLQIPSTHNRFYVLPEEGGVQKFILLDDVIRLQLPTIFSIFKFSKIEAFTFKFSRDAEMTFDDDITLDIRQKMEKSIKNRKKGIAVRFVYDELMPISILAVLTKGLNIRSTSDILPGGKYHNFKDFMKFPDFGKKHLIYQKLAALKHPGLDENRSVLRQLMNKDHLLYFPYQRFDYIVDLLCEAALDPKVARIKINLYRVAFDSKIVNALLSAVQNGKEVTTIVELQARFDEENNLYWAERLQEEGAKVLFGIPSLKIHSKLLYIERNSGAGKQELAFVGTGNFNEATAKIYSDFGYFTSNKNIVDEVKKVFKFIENPLIRNIKFEYLQVSPFNARSAIAELIQKEIHFVKQGKSGSIQLKLNNLVDKKNIDLLLSAAQAGVKITIIVRGICCLVPEFKKEKSNVEIISIVDRFLEHSRMMIFGNNGRPKFYISSADWMERNMDRRIEVGVPILDKNIQKELRHFFNLQKSDSFKGRMLVKNRINNYVIKVRKEETDSQLKTYEYLKG